MEKAAQALINLRGRLRNGLKQGTLALTTQRLQRNCQMVTATRSGCWHLNRSIR